MRILLLVTGSYLLIGFATMSLMMFVGLALTIGEVTRVVRHGGSELLEAAFAGLVVAMFLVLCWPVLSQIVFETIRPKPRLSPRHV